MKKRAGYVKNFIPLAFLAVVMLLLVYDLQKRQIHAINRTVEDALAESNLASAIIDIREYGISHQLVIKDTDRAYEIYKDALRYNMGLNSEWEHPGEGMISGKVEVMDYIVYSVSGNDVDVTSYGDNPYTTFYSNGLGSVTAPNGQLVESTSVYSRITFPVEAYRGITATAVKDKLVDVVSE